MYNYISDTLIIGKKVIYLPSCHSTNDIAAEIVHAGLFEEGTVVITDHQVQGRGQRGTNWNAEQGQNLTFSVILKPQKLPVEDQFVISQLTSLAIRSYVACYIPDTFIKWPNDIYTNRKKICGILIENAIQGGRLSHSIIGIGLNINQQQFEGRATSLSQETKNTYSLVEEFGKLARFLDAYYVRLYSEKSISATSQEYLNQLYGYQTPVRVLYQNKQLNARVNEVSRDGRLVLTTENGELIHAGLKEIEWIFE